MNAKQILLGTVLIAFATFTGLVLIEHGLVGAFRPLFESSGGLQVGLDLVIALTLFVVWMVGDARQRGLSPAFYVVLICSTGSIGALIYLLRREAVAPAGNPQPALG
jgi:hypothetical protein